MARDVRSGNAEAESRGVAPKSITSVPLGASGRRPPGAPRARIVRRALGLATADSLAWAVGLFFASLLRMDFVPSHVHWGSTAKVIPVAVALALGTGLVVHLYGGRFRIGTADEVGTLVVADLLITTVLFCANLLVHRPIPASVPIGSGLVTLLLSLGARLAWRRRREMRRRPNAEATRLLVLGAGEAGASIAEQMMVTPESPYLPIAFLDDDPMKRHLRIAGVPVLGNRHEVVRVAELVDARALLLAIPSASTQLVREVLDLAQDAGLPVRVLPSMQELIDGRVSLKDIRPLAERELLGRPPVRIDVSSVAAAVHSKRVLVTGAGGSIGAELCRQLADLEPARLVMLDRDESALHASQLSLSGRALLNTDDVVVADIRDASRMRYVFAGVRPQLVFHAAALKHLPLLELHPGEAVKTNVLGTQNVLDSSLEFEVETFVNISTDKAADPVSVLGFTKRITERLTASAASCSRRSYVSVRFGNVLGSRGSLLSIFQAQIAARLPVTVTHPDVTRYFMTAEEAVQLVLQASVIGRSGEVLVLDMGAPVSIRRLAERLLAESPGAPGVVFTGLRRGEKLHEALFANDECDERPLHPQIAHVAARPLDPRALVRLDGLPDGELVVALAALSQQPDSDSATSVDEPAYLVLDGHGLVTSANVTARRMLRTPHEQIVGYPLADFGRPVLSRDGSTLQPDDHPGEVTRRTGRAVDDCVVGIRRPDGNRVWLSVTTRALHFEGRYLNTVVFIAELAMTSDGEPVDPGRQSSPDATSDEFVAPP